jgi:protein-S-isoprenylcysteine O-methyltransferase Ste14
MKLSRLKKLSWKLLSVYALLIDLITFADRSPMKWKHWNFWVGCALLAFSLWIRIWASGHLVKNKVLTFTGPYAYVKNPLYIGTFFGMIGLAFLAMGPRDPGLVWWQRHLNWLVLGLGLLVFVFYYVPYKKKREGERLHDIFGEAWDHYDKAVPDYFPSTKRYERATVRPWSWAATKDNSEHWAPLAYAVGVAALLFNGPLLAWVERLLVR